MAMNEANEDAEFGEHTDDVGENWLGGGDEDDEDEFFSGGDEDYEEEEEGVSEEEDDDEVVDEADLEPFEDRHRPKEPSLTLIQTLPQVSRQD